jgi:hypothetical protein
MRQSKPVNKEHHLRVALHQPLSNFKSPVFIPSALLFPVLQPDLGFILEV